MQVMQTKQVLVSAQAQMKSGSIAESEDRFQYAARAEGDEWKHSAKYAL